MSFLLKIISIIPIPYQYCVLLFIYFLLLVTVSTYLTPLGDKERLTHNLSFAFGFLIIGAHWVP